MHVTSIGFVLFIRKPLSNSALFFFFFFFPFSWLHTTHEALSARLWAASSGRRDRTGHGFPGQKATQQGSEQESARRCTTNSSGCNERAAGRAGSCWHSPEACLHRGHRPPQGPRCCPRGDGAGAAGTPLRPRPQQQQQQQRCPACSRAGLPGAAVLQLMCFSLQALQAS